MTREFTAIIVDKRGNTLAKSEGHITRIDAAREVFKLRPNATRCSTGYGVGGHLGIQWHDRADIV